MPDATEPREAAPTPVPAPRTTVFGEAEALAVWARAARLQADAENAGTAVPPADPAAAPRVTIAEGTGAPAGLYLADEIVAAGRQAGIGERYLELALAEHDALGRDAALAAEAIDERDRVRLTGLTTRSVQVSRVIPEAPATVLARLREAVGEAPWSLAFDGVAGPHPELGGILRFTVPVIGADHAPRPLTSFIYHASRLGMTHLHVTLGRRGTAESPGCEVAIIGDFRAGEQMSLRWYKALQALLLGTWTIAGGLVGAKQGTAIATLIGAAGGLAASGLLALVFRGLARSEHRWAHRTLTAGLDALLRRVQRPGDEARAFAPARVVLRPPSPEPAEPGQPMRAGPRLAAVAG